MEDSSLTGKCAYYVIVTSNRATELHWSLHSLGWRWAFLLQLPLFFAAFSLVTFYLNYVTPVRIYDGSCHIVKAHSQSSTGKE